MGAAGGAPAFLRFVREELVPFVEREHRASSERILVGHSFGGLFATWVALTDPAAFGGYIIVSPSLWYDHGHVFGLEARPARTTSDLPMRIYLAVGSREMNGRRNMVADLRRLVTTLER